MFSFMANPKEFWSGVMFLFFGIAAVVLGWDYEMGNAGQMGPGYFPLVLGSFLIVIGLASSIRAFFHSGEALGRFAMKEACLVLGAVLLFSLLMRSAGTVLAMVALVMMSAIASTRFRWKQALIFAVCAAAFCVLVFVFALGVPMPIIGSWFGA